MLLNLHFRHADVVPLTVIVKYDATTVSQYHQKYNLVTIWQNVMPCQCYILACNFVWPYITPEKQLGS